MAQQIWHMKDVTGAEYTLGLYHGEESGNLMVYLNNAIMIIDFKIKQNKDYHFYIGKEFMLLRIKKISEHYEYSLTVDTESDTPYNLSIRKQAREEQYLMIIGMGVVIILLTLFFLFRNIF